MRIASGSYEGCLFGWHLDETAAEKSQRLTQDWGFKACPGAIRCMAVSSNGAFLVCGGVDERIYIFDMHTNKSLGELSQHTGAINSLQFYESTYLLSASEDGTVCIWRVQDWECVHILGGHKASVSDIAVHFSGKLALSISRDHTLKVWNLVQGRCSFTRRLKSTADRIHFERSGVAYLIVGGNSVQVYLTADNSLLTEITHSLRINQALFLPAEEEESGVSGTAGTAGLRVVSVGEDRQLRVTRVSGDTVATLDLTALGGRARDLALLPSTSSSSSPPDVQLALISSSGALMLLNVPDIVRGAGYDDCVAELTRVPGEPRFICLAAWSNTQNHPSGLKVVTNEASAPSNITSKNKRKAEANDSLANAVVDIHIKEEASEEMVSIPAVGVARKLKKKQKKEAKKAVSFS